MAEAVHSGIENAGAVSKLMSLKEFHRSDIATEILEAGGIFVGTPTLNAQVFPTVADILVYLKGLKRQNLIGAAFGSYGWSPQGVKYVENILSEMKVEQIAPGLTVKYVPTEEDRKTCFELGKKAGGILSTLDSTRE